MTYTLILLRHGQSDWNQKNLFTGWVDVDLSDQGRAEARRAGELLAESGILPKAQTLAEYGQEQFMTWRRSFDVPPPPLDDDSEFSQAHDPRYAGLGADLPRTESLKLVIDRMLPYWESEITVDLAAGKTVLVTAHGNSLRALVKHLDHIADDAIAELNIPTGIPLVYTLDETFAPLKPGKYLDPEAAAAGAAAVAAQGKS
jgi:2,3-bisphosphoglycerate-dependent phosphoglycerate mutase